MKLKFDINKWKLSKEKQKVEEERRKKNEEEMQIRAEIEKKLNKQKHEVLLAYSITTRIKNSKAQ